MKLVPRKTGTFTHFIDFDSDEILLRIETNKVGLPIIGFKLYDSCGKLVSVQDEAKSFPQGLRIRSFEDESLLVLPAEDNGNVEYRLYNGQGKLLTSSDGKRTQIFSGLRVEGSPQHVSHKSQA